MRRVSRTAGTADAMIFDMRLLFALLGASLSSCRSVNPEFVEQERASSAHAMDTEGDAEDSDEGEDDGSGEGGGDGAEATTAEATSGGDATTLGSDDATGSGEELDCTDCEPVQGMERAFCLCPSPGSWAEAELDCQARGGVLTAIEDAQENDTLTQAAAGLSDVMGADFWIGLSRSDDGTWAWVDGRPLSYTNWSAGSPGGANNDCAEMQLSNGQWNDSACSSQQQGFICSSLD